MSHLNYQSSVGQWVAAHPRTARVFEDLKIDYCCGGGKPLEQACRARGLDPAEVLQRLQQTLEDPFAASDVNWSQAKLTDLCDHIEQTHHAYLKFELPRLTGLIAKVCNAHGKAHPKLSQLQQVFAELRAELEPHMFKEEQVLFPAIRRIEQEGAAPAFAFGTVANPIRMMEQEHDDAGDGLARIRELTDGFAIPADACNTYRAMLDGLRELEEDMHQHVHKENNILFPRACELETSQRSGSATSA